MADLLREVWRKRKVLEVTGNSNTTLWRLINSDDPNLRFPRPVELGARNIGFYSDEVLEWINSRPRCSGKVKK